MAADAPALSPARDANPAEVPDTVAPAATRRGSGQGGRPRVVVAGAGFGGTTLVQELDGAPVEVVLVDRRNHHTFQPLLYQVATASLEPADVAYPVRGLLDKVDNASFRLGEVVGLDTDRRELQFAEGPPLAYDHLVLAVGAETATFGVPGVEEHAFGLKSVADGLRMRDHLLREVERADGRPEAIEEGALSVTICGGGPTGVELAGATAELFGHVLDRDFPALDFDRAEVVLAEMDEHVLPGMGRDQQDYAADQLTARGVRLQLGTPVTEVRAREIELEDGTTIPSGTTIWTAGIQANPLVGALGLDQGPQGRLVVDDSLAVPDQPGMWALGDVATVGDEPHPQLAAVAIQSAKHVAEAIRRDMTGQPAKPFHYRDKGTMTTIGRRAAVADLPLGITLKDTPGWLAWLALHLVQLTGGRNRVSVLTNWAWSYLRWHKPGRLIIGTDESTRGMRTEPQPPR